MAALRSRELPAVLTIHWGWVLGASIVEQALLGYFNWHRWSSLNVIEVWSYVQAMFLYIGGDVLLLGSWLLKGKAHAPMFAGVSFIVVFLAVVICGAFVFRRDMQRYFNEVDGTGLKLSPWMTLFFNTIYFQYHFYKIAQFKRQHPEPTPSDLV